MSIGRYQAYRFGELSFIKDKVFEKNVEVESRSIIKLLEQEALKDPKITVGKALESILDWNGIPPLSVFNYKTTVMYSAVDELGLWNISDHKLRDYVKLKYLENLKR